MLLVSVRHFVLQDHVERNNLSLSLHTNKVNTEGKDGSNRLILAFDLRRKSDIVTSQPDLFLSDMWQWYYISDLMLLLGWLLRLWTFYKGMQASLTPYIKSSPPPPAQHARLLRCQAQLLSQIEISIRAPAGHRFPLTGLTIITSSKSVLDLLIRLEASQAAQYSNYFYNGWFSSNYIHSMSTFSAKAGCCVSYTFPEPWNRQSSFF